MNTNPGPAFLCRTNTADIHRVLIMKPGGLGAVAAAWATSALTWLTYVQGARNVLFGMLLTHNMFLYRQG